LSRRGPFHYSIFGDPITQLVAGAEAQICPIFTAICPFQGKYANRSVIKGTFAQGMVVAVFFAWKVEDNPMKNYLKIGFLLAPLAIAGFTPALAQNASEDYYRQWVDYQDGQISVTFDQTPVDFALYAIHAKTGFQILIPANVETKFVNLRLERQPLESAVRSVISTIGFRNFAMLYDENGQPHRAVVLGVQPLPAVSAAERPERIVAPLTIEESDKLQQDLDRWNDLKEEERGRIEDRLRNSPPSDEREFLVREYGRQVLGLK
jgi:hypothetical protein